jgi:hypothetical protein
MQAKIRDINQINKRTSLVRDLDLLLFNGNNTTKSLSIPIATFMKTLAETEIVCMKMTIGHMGSENIQERKTTSPKVNGIQKTAIIKSATAKFTR